MQMSKGSWTSAILALGFISSQAFAGATVSCDGRSNIDFSDAGNGYGVACHQTDRWQSLGDDWDRDNLSDASNTGNDDATDDGVTWRTSSDNGATWTDYGTGSAVTQGDLVEFRFEFTRSNDGWHQFDELKTWVDWDQDVSWSNADEVVTNVRWAKNENADDTYVGGPTFADQTDHKNYCYANGQTWNGDLKTCNSNDTFRVFTEQVQVPLDAALGETWMRARVVCENSLTNYSPNFVMDATGYQDQGEVEDYAITVLAKRNDPPVQVPEPSGLLLLATGLFFLARRASA